MTFLFLNHSVACCQIPEFWRRYNYFSIIIILGENKSCTFDRFKKVTEEGTLYLLTIVMGNPVYLTHCFQLILKHYKFFYLTMI